jgi:cell division protein ZapA
MTQGENNSSIEVEIFDQAYKLRGNDPGYIRKLAEYVDGKMRAVAELTSTVDSARLAVLAALNIADEYHLVETKLKGKESRKTSPKPFTEEERQRTWGRRQQHYTKRRYEKELLAIANDESLPTKERHEALFTLGQVRGYHRGLPANR